MKSLVFCLLIASALAAPSGLPKFKRGLNKIVGGEDAEKGEIKYQISYQDISFGAFHFCGGSVFSDTWMITAAHCVNGEDFDNPKNLQIVAGDYTLYTDEGTEQTVKVIQIIQHEDFDRSTFENDVALLKVSSPLVFDASVQPIALPATQDMESTGDSLITGWGDTTEGGSAPDVLQKVTIPIVTDDECRVSYGENEIYDSMICAGIPDGGLDSCQGDSGGPMVCNANTVIKTPYLCGIVSWGYGCARPDYPGVYTQVSYFVDWITNNAV